MAQAIASMPQAANDYVELRVGLYAAEQTYNFYLKSRRGVFV